MTYSEIHGQSGRLVCWDEGGETRTGILYAARSGGWDAPDSEGIAEVIVETAKIPVERLRFKFSALCIKRTKPLSGGGDA